MLTDAGPPRSRTVELVLAHAHLRLGALALARVELETMAGLGLLDTSGLVDLAEVRWRTGDLLRAGEAATAALRDDEDLPVALVVAAEAAAALGRPTEARRLASRVIDGAPTSVDAIFAGMPRSSVWPDDAAEPPPTAPTLFDREPEHPGRVDVGEPAGRDPAPMERTRNAPTTSPVALGFWDSEAGLEPATVPLPDPAMELEAGRDALVAGALEEAALRFGLALRFAPALAPAVLEATDGARSTGLTIVRGDAYRLAGHEIEARQAYAVAAQGGLPERRLHPRTGGTLPETLSAADAVETAEVPAADVATNVEATDAEVTDADAPLAATATETENAAETDNAAESDEATDPDAAATRNDGVEVQPDTGADAAAASDTAATQADHGEVEPETPAEPTPEG